MNKADLARVATLAAPALSHRAAREVVDAIFSEIAGAVTHGERVIITGFGAFSRVEREGRLGRNPRTGEPVPIAAAPQDQVEVLQQLAQETVAAFDKPD